MMITLLRSPHLRPTAALAAFLLSYAQAPGQTPVHRWVFEGANVAGTTINDSVGSLNGTIQGPFEWSANPPSMSFTNAGYVEIDPAMNTALLPQSALTVETWISLRSPGSWPGFAGCLQDNGAFERGWWLGANGSKFLFALAADTTMTYMSAPTTFDLDKWYHVVATYDGTTMALYVNGQNVVQSGAESGNINYSPAPFTLGAYKDDNEVYPMDGNLREVALYDVALNASEVQQRYDAQKALFPAVPDPPTANFTPVLGPFVRFDGVADAKVIWETATPQPSLLDFSGPGVIGQQVSDPTPKTRHELTLPNLGAKTTYSYVLHQDTGSGDQTTDVYHFETDFHYRIAPVPDRPSPFPDDGNAAAYSALADAIVTQTAITKGYVLDYGATDARLAFELVKRTDLNVMIASPDPQTVATLRTQLHDAGVYGGRVSVALTPLNQLPYTKNWFNLIVSSSAVAGSGIPGDAAEMFRVLRPSGGMALLGLPTGIAGSLPGGTAAAIDSWTRNGISAREATIVTDPDRATTVTRLPLSGIGEWSHNFGDPGQSCSSSDQRVRGVDMKVQWFGDPGPRGFSDRQARNPTPLTVNGTLYTQGDNRIAAQDAYNGRVYWSMEIPDARRVNMPRDGGNWCADPTSLFLAHRDKLWRLDHYTGELLQHYEVPSTPETHDWGYVASVGDRVYGSSVKKDSFYTVYDGSWEFWYDSTNALNEIAKICSDSFFCLDKSDGSTRWTYDAGVVINNTIVIGGGRVYFVDCRNPTIQSYSSGRVDHNGLWQDNYLVALDAETGALLWEHELNGSTAPILSVPVSPYPVVFYLCYADEKLALLSSTTQYHIKGVNAVDGSLLWSKTHNWVRNHHGGHMYHPIILDNPATPGKLLIAEPYGYNLSTGVLEKSGLPSRGGCSTMSASANTVHYINWDYSIGSPYFWDIDTNVRRKMAGTRSSCWLSVISGGGMIMLPPGSAGCACRFPLQSSITFSAP